MEVSKKMHVGTDASIEFVKDETKWFGWTRLNEGVTSITVGTREAKHIEVNDPIVEEVVSMNSSEFCEAVEFVGRCYESRSTFTANQIRCVEQDFERVIEALRIRASMNDLNREEVDALWMMIDAHSPGTGIPYAGTEGFYDQPAHVTIPEHERAHLPA